LIVLVQPLAPARKRKAHAAARVVYEADIAPSLTVLSGRLKDVHRAREAGQRFPSQGWLVGYDIGYP
jgi:hypothetical protein